MFSANTNIGENKEFKSKPKITNLYADPFARSLSAEIESGQHPAQESAWRKLIIPRKEAETLKNLKDLFSWIKTRGLVDVELMYIDPELDRCSLRSCTEFKAWQTWNKDTGSDFVVWFQPLRSEDCNMANQDIETKDSVQSCLVEISDPPMLNKRIAKPLKAQKPLYHSTIIATHPLSFQSISPSEFVLRLRWTVKNTGRTAWTMSVRFLPLNLTALSLLSVRIPFLDPQQSGLLQVTCRLPRPLQLKILYFQLSHTSTNDMQEQHEHLFNPRFEIPLDNKELEHKVIFHEAYQMCDFLNIKMSKTEFRLAIHKLQKQWKDEFVQRIRTPSELVSYVIEQQEENVVCAKK